MKNEIPPIALAGIIILVVVMVVAFGYRAMQPASYTPSPGISRSGGAVPGAVSVRAPGADPSSSASTSQATPYYPAAPPGSIPGKPVGH